EVEALREEVGIDGRGLLHARDAWPHLAFGKAADRVADQPLFFREPGEGGASHEVWSWRPNLAPVGNRGFSRDVLWLSFIVTVCNRLANLAKPRAARY